MADQIVAHWRGLGTGLDVDLGEADRADPVVAGADTDVGLADRYLQRCERVLGERDELAGRVT